MDQKEFARKLGTIIEAEADDIDETMLTEAAVQDDGTFISLNTFKTFMDYNGKMSLQIPTNGCKK